MRVAAQERLAGVGLDRHAPPVARAVKATREPLLRPENVRLAGHSPRYLQFECPDDPINSSPVCSILRLQAFPKPTSNLQPPPSYQMSPTVKPSGNGSVGSTTY